MIGDSALSSGPLIGVLLSFFSGAEAQHHHNGEREQESGNGGHLQMVPGVISVRR